ITLLHENAEGTYGDTIERCADLLTNSRSAHLQAVLDPANFIQVGQTRYPDAYLALRTRVRYLRVKDALPNGTVVPAGDGTAQWQELLAALRIDGYSGFFSLDPQLTDAGEYQGFSGPELFRQASHAFQRLLRQMDWTPEE
ncbi:MAG: TIM barrel protein, partial [Chloroflexota bacterium]|nr:TIM barrel protein [Chloroflexota bacterium]